MKKKTTMNKRRLAKKEAKEAKQKANVHRHRARRRTANRHIGVEITRTLKAIRRKLPTPVRKEATR